MAQRTVVITGASSGIGEAAAKHMARTGWQVFAGVRSDKDAAHVDGLHARVTPLRVDVTDADSLSSARQTVEDALDGATLGGLVNNAGIAQLGPLTLQPFDEIKAHFDVNVLGAIAAAQQFAPLLGQDTSRTGAPGRIVNITSVGGEVASPFLGAYTATKHALESVTDTLRRELKMYGIDAVVVGPGSVKTPIWDKAKKEDLPYQDTDWADSYKEFLNAMIKGGQEGFPPERVAEDIAAALTDDSPKARYAPVPNKLQNYYLLTMLPKRMTDKLFVKRFNLDKRAQPNAS